MTCAAQSISYANTDPLMMVRAKGTRMYDERGRCFLDTRNNVCHVGHAHPAVVRAVAAQAAAINTNTRYLHPNLVHLAELLLSKCPAPLAKVFFVNSGSEANDLAIRLARAHTGNRGMVVVDHAYHGHTVEVINVSPYKFAHKCGPGKAPHVQVVNAPDVYRGKHRGGDAAHRYAEQVHEACGRCVESGDGVGAFFVESGMSVAGVIVPPSGYLAECYATVRSHGGLCVADEVQVGFGRFGSSFWGFESQGVVPDVVTLGKPFGNGMPLGAVITTEAVAASFANGLEYVVCRCRLRCCLLSLRCRV